MRVFPFSGWGKECFVMDYVHYKMKRLLSVQVLFLQ